MLSCRARLSPIPRTFGFIITINVLIVRERGYISKQRRAHASLRLELEALIRFEIYSSTRTVNKPMYNNIADRSMSIYIPSTKHIKCAMGKVLFVGQYLSFTSFFFFFLLPITELSFRTLLLFATIIRHNHNSASQYAFTFGVHAVALLLVLSTNLDMQWLTQRMVIVRLQKAKKGHFYCFEYGNRLHQMYSFIV